MSGGGFGLFLSELFGLGSGAFFLLGPLFGLCHRFGLLLGAGFRCCCGFGLSCGFETGFLRSGCCRPGIFLSFCADQSGFGLRLLAGDIRCCLRFFAGFGPDCRQFLFGILACLFDGSFEFLLGSRADGGNFGGRLLTCLFDQRLGAFRSICR